MNTFVNAIGAAAMRPNLAKARTANGMSALASTANHLVDLFGSIGAMRGKNVIPAFEKAFRANPDVAVRIAQFARDVRGGSGERKLYRDILLWLEANEPNLLVESNLLDNTVNIGRFDDLLIFTNPMVKAKAFSIIASALMAENGLAAKWMPRKGPIAAELRTYLGMSPKMYRKTLVSLTNVVETAMCSGNWNEINFSHVPSVAMSKYMTAFHRNAPEHMQAYKDALVKGTPGVKVNSSAVYPHDVIAMLGGFADLSHGYGSLRNVKTQNIPVAQAMWDALPNFMNGANVIAVADNSGSMATNVGGSTTIRCGDVAASLAMYVADKSTGAFKDLSISFNDKAEFIQHKGDLVQRLTAVCKASWGSTNLHSVFNLVLNHALQNNVPESDMPKIILILSDMQFNADRAYDDSAQQMIRRKYEQAGYALPTIVYWNLNDSGNKPVRFNERGVALVSGFSPSVMKAILAANLDKFSPESIMLEAVMIDRYSW